MKQILFIVEYSLIYFVGVKLNGKKGVCFLVGSVNSRLLFCTLSTL